jgi:hypothetical protein
MKSKTEIGRVTFPAGTWQCGKKLPKSEVPTLKNWQKVGNMTNTRRVVVAVDDTPAPSLIKKNNQE